jgi:tRNA modification GTPase
LALVEAGIDFADEEDVVAISSGDLQTRLDLMSLKLQSVAESHGGGEPVDGRCRVVLRGPANAGKSTLFNALLGRKRVVTHDAAGTTRDAIVERGSIGGQDVLLVDTPGDDGDIVSASAEDAQHEADIVLWCDPVPRDSTPLGDRMVFVQTKRDLTPGEADSDVRVCAFDTGDVSRLAAIIAGAIQGRRAARGHLSLTHRQQGLAQAARQCMLDAVGIASGDRAESGLTRPAEVAALLRAGLNDLGAITGEIPPDDVLGLVFAGFCVGK